MSKEKRRFLVKFSSPMMFGAVVAVMALKAVVALEGR